MDRTDALFYVLCLIVYVAGCLVGGATAYRSTTNHWQAWAIENKYAHYGRETGELVLHEIEGEANK